mmetsp:Transcript_9705/g.1437  ORF Transcript_9705/g.1437 Transcript_9705/m.1437 type:complete len:92 (+) Transcript_9705:776-1051(+)
MGDDFAYFNAELVFTSLDSLMNYVNETDYNINIQYSNLSDYFYKAKRARKNLGVKHDNFFPYSDYENAYWTGYYSSRTGLKEAVRVLSDII